MRKNVDKYNSTQQIFTRLILIGAFFLSWLVSLIATLISVGLGFYNHSGKVFLTTFLLIVLSPILILIMQKILTYKKTTIKLPVSSTMLNLSGFLYSSKIQKDTFEPIVSDWNCEYFESLSKKEVWKSQWVNVYYMYAFIIAMWQKSPIGDLIEYISKLAK